MTETAVLTLCSTCNTGDRTEDMAAISKALKRAGLGETVMVRQAACLGACEDPVSLGIQGPGRASYVFSGVNPQEDASDIASTCRTYLQAEKGWIEDARPCGRLRHCLRARLPATGN